MAADVMWSAARRRNCKKCIEAGTGASRVEDGRIGYGYQHSRVKEQYNMKHLKIAGLCLVSIFVMGMAMASTASAVWEGCLETSKTTKYENNKCVKALAGGKFGWAEITNTDNVRSVGFTIKLTDTKAALPTSVICTAGGVGSGTVGPGEFDRIETAEQLEPKKNCRATGGCEPEKVEEVKGVNLPWQTRLSRKEGKILDTIEGTGNGPPGWRTRCESIIHTTETDTCTERTGEPESARLTNELTGGVQLVLANFETAVKANCTIGGESAGEIGGTIAILLANAKGEASGIGLRVS
jgi:hypothetical protein